MRVMVSRSEVDMLDIRASFQKKYGASLYTTIQVPCFNKSEGAKVNFFLRHVTACTLIRISQGIPGLSLELLAHEEPTNPNPKHHCKPSPNPE